MARDLSALTPCQRIERSIQKKYRDTLWGPFITGVKQYALIRPGDRVCVCISGGKDSMLLAKLLQLLQLLLLPPYAQPPLLQVLLPLLPLTQHMCTL